MLAARTNTNPVQNNNMSNNNPTKPAPPDGTDYAFPVVGDTSKPATTALDTHQAAKMDLQTLINQATQKHIAHLYQETGRLRIHQAQQLQALQNTIAAVSALKGAAADGATTTNKDNNRGGNGKSHNDSNNYPAQSIVDAAVLAAARKFHQGVVMPEVKALRARVDFLERLVGDLDLDLDLDARFEEWMAAKRKEEAGEDGEMVDLLL
ncbi:hypothetical protein VTK26DRAFT_8109 [Humicola hyalothermophila]